MTDAAETSRRVALEALLRIEDGAYAHILVPQLLRQRQLSGRDRGMVTDLVYGSVRMQGALDHLLRAASSRGEPQVIPAPMSQISSPQHQTRG